MKQSSRSRFWSLSILTLAALLFAGAAQAQQTIQFNVAVTGGSAPVKVTVHENPEAPAWAATVLAVHGFTETAAMWTPLKSALFAHPATKHRVKRVIALDLPGHGLSPIPTLASGLFGNLTIYDNVAVVIQVVDQLRAQGIGPRVLMGHSMGGLAVQAAQEQLLSQGSSLASHGVLRAILLAPVPVANITAWTPAAGSLPQQYYRFDNGTYIVLDAPGALFGGGFSTLASTPTAPVITPAAFTLDLSNQIGAEPSVTAAQLVGAIPTLPRPSARQGAFALRNGTLLTLIGFSQDILTPAALQPALYEHLLGRSGFMYEEIVAPDAVHSMVITNPQGILDQLFDFSNMF
jgi:pimeloyl-ACP methyl ester carboxylesterase